MCFSLLFLILVFTKCAKDRYLVNPVLLLRSEEDRDILKVAFIQKAWMNLSFPQTDKPYYFPELEF